MDGGSDPGLAAARREAAERLGGYDAARQFDGVVVGVPPAAGLLGVDVGEWLGGFVGFLLGVWLGVALAEWDGECDGDADSLVDGDDVTVLVTVGVGFGLCE